MSLEVNGKIVKVLDVESGVSKAGKEWKKQNFVIDTGDQYNPEIAFSIFGEEKVENFAKFNKVGDEVKVCFNASSREHNGRYYHNLDAWRIESNNQTSGQALTAEAEPQPIAEDDLPF